MVQNEQAIHLSDLQWRRQNGDLLVQDEYAIHLNDSLKEMKPRQYCFHVKRFGE